MAKFRSVDGTELAYRRAGSGPVVVCLPGGPMQASTYLGDLGGLSTQLCLVRLDLRGTGDSALPADPATFRCDWQVDDVEALRRHLGLDRMNLLAHSAGASLAVAYAVQHPDRIERLALITPSSRSVDLPITDQQRRLVAELRRNEVWFPEAYAAFERIWAGDATAEDWIAITPFTYGRWDGDASAHAALGASQRNTSAAAVFASSDAPDPGGARAALACLPAPVRLTAGEHDVALPPDVAVEYAKFFRQAELAVEPGGGHYPWLDDPVWFVRTVETFVMGARST